MNFILLIVRLISSLYFYHHPDIHLKRIADKNDKNKDYATYSATVRVKFYNFPTTDSIFVFLSTEEVYDRKLAGQNERLFPGKIINDHYIFELPILKSFTYYRLIGKRSTDDTINHNTVYYNITAENYLTPGDDLTALITYHERPNKPAALKNRVLVNEFKAKYAGKGADKCILKNRIDSIIALPDKILSNNIQTECFTNKDSLFKIILDSIDLSAKSAETDLYHALKADIYFAMNKASLSLRSKFYRDAKKRKDPMYSMIRKQYSDLLEKNLQKDSVTGISRYFLCNTINYIPFLFENIRAMAYFQLEKQIDRASVPLSVVRTTHFIDLILTNTKAETRDYLLMYYFRNTSKFDDFEGAINKAVAVVESKIVKEYLKSLNLFAGREKAYNFSLIDEAGRKVQLNDFSGKVVVLDFWFTYCKSCADYFGKTLSKVEDTFRQDPDVVFISISTDVVREMWIKGIKSGKYTSVDAVNLYTGGRGVLDSVIKAYKVNAYPLPILIDRQGFVREYATKDMYNKELLIKKIRSLL
jgi:cytochrome oxidase Cu insertion factor (SCO1/SenC/PrrC family)